MKMDKNLQNLDEMGREFLSELYREKYNSVLTYVRGALNVDSLMLAEDIVQDTFFEAACRTAELRMHPNPGGWLMETARYKMMAQARRASSRDVYYGDECEYELKRLEQQYNMAEMNLILSSIFSEQELKVFYEYYLLGYSGKEIADREGITEGNLKVKMHRLKKKLLEKLDIA